MRTSFTCLLLLTVLSMFGQQPGRLTDTVICKLKPEEKYALYLPKPFEATKEYQLLLFLDPGGRAATPLTNYAELANRYNLIFACSYNSKNGPIEPSVKAVYAMIDDLTMQYRITRSSIWLSGFSGGARVATLLGIYDKSISGVIACGAAFPTAEKISKGRNLPYALVAGNQDMNYVEALDAADYLKSINNPVTRFEFDNGHQWPPVDVFERALLWHLTRNGRLSIDEVKEHYDHDMREAISASASDHALESELLASQIKSQYIRYEIHSFSDSLLNIIDNSKVYLQQRKHHDDIVKKEREISSKFFNTFYKVLATLRPDTAFQKSQWSSFSKVFSKLKKSDDQSEKNLGKRLLNATTMAVAEHMRMEIAVKNFEKALLCAEIWNTIDPKTPWSLFSLARVYALKKEPKPAIENLEKAITNGFNEKSRITTDPAFDDLKNNEKFNALLNRL